MFYRDLEPFNNVVNDGRAVLNSTQVIGNTVESVQLIMGTQGGTPLTPAQIAQIRVKLNQKVVWEISGPDLVAMLAYDAIQNAAILDLDFADPRADTVRGQGIGAIDTSAGVNSFVIECDIVGGDAPTLKAKALLSPPKRNDRAAIRALVLSTLPVTSAAEHTLDVNLGSVQGSNIRRLHIYHEGILDKFEVVRDSVEVFEEVTNAQNEHLATRYGHVPQADVFVWDLVVDGDQQKSMRTLRPGNKSARNFQFKFTTNAAGTIRVYADLYTGLRQL